jgi:hypothetical protein
MSDFEKVMRICEKRKASKYSDEEIKRDIGRAEEIEVTEFANLSAMIAQAKIAYNQMIDEDTERVEKSWGL